MEPRYRLRIYLLTALVLAGCGALVARLYEFQIERRDEFQKLVPGDRTVTVREPGIRGTIQDRNGIELARNQRKYEITFNLAEIHQAYRLQAEEDPKRDTVGSEKGMPRAKTESDIVKIVNDRIIPPLAKLGLAANYSATKLRVHYLTHGGLVPFSYRTDVDYDQFARFAEHSLELPGVYLNVQPQREYPYQALCSHMLGYVQPWDQKDIPEDAARRFHHYVGDERGVMGLEATLNDILRGPAGEKKILKNEKGKVLGLIDYIKPGTGAEVTLTIDASVQHLVSTVLRRAGTAAAVVMDVRTGEILAMASVPDYNPNDFIPSISSARKKEYDDNIHHPFIDRAINAFQPGSTFKVPTAIAGAMRGLAGRSYVCSGGVNFGTQRVRCWIAQKGGSHGGLDLAKAIQQSCNPYFMLMANNVGTKGMVDSFHMLGFGRPTGIPLPGEKAGIVIGSQDWQNRFPNERPSPVNNAFLSIGQGQSMATPLQLCALTACVANGGRYYEPRLVKKAVGANGEIFVEDKPRLKVDLLKEGAKPADIERIREGMRMAVNQPGGTAGRTKLPDHVVAAKTGTAQAEIAVVNGRKYQRHNAWTIAFAPYDEPRYAVCVLVREGKSGGKVATPLVNLILSGLFARDEGKRLPLHPLDPAAGALDAIEEIELPKDVLAELDLTDEPEETGDEAAEAIEASGIVPVDPTDTQPQITPKAVLTPEIDEEGTVVPRARTVEE